MSSVQDPLGYLHDPATLLTPRSNPLAYQLPSDSLTWHWGNRIATPSGENVNSNDPLLEKWDATTRNTLTSALANRDRGGSRQAIASRATPPPATGLELDEILESSDRPKDEYELDDVGNLIAVSDADGRVQRFSVSRFRCRGTDERPDGGVTQYEYNIREHVTRITDPRGSVHDYLRDPNDRITEIRQDGHTLAHYVYDPAGNISSKLDGLGHLVFRWERGLGGVGLRRHFGNGDVEEFTHDESGRIVSAVNPSAKCEFAYGFAGQRPLVDLRDDEGIVHAHDDQGNPATNYFEKFVVTTQANGNRTKITDPTGATHVIESGTGGLLSIDLADQLHVLHHYDQQGKPTKKIARMPGGSLWNREYEYSAAGKLLQSNDSLVGDRSCQYDSNGRIASVGTSEQYRWDRADNLLSTPNLQDNRIGSGNRLVAADGHRFAYDDRGRLTEHHSPDKTRHFRYDDMDRLVECDVDGRKWQGEYDPLCRLVRSHFGKWTVENFWDGFRLAARRWNDGRLRIYVYADQAALVPFLLVDYESADADPADGKRYYLFTDQVGMPVRAIDENGHSVWSATSEAFGKLTIDRASQIQINIRFPGHLFDSSLGLHHNRFRNYDPVLGRYLQIDPIGVVGGVNTYTYCPDPLSEVDFDGLSTCDGAGDGNGVTPNGDTPSGANASKKTVENPIDLTDFRKAHILNRHGPGRGRSGKTEFPADWSDEKVLHEISDVATDPASTVTPGRWGADRITGTRDGIEITVDLYPSNSKHAGKISTGYPTNTPVNP